ncbi:hypothetical protein MW887_006539, partial [Aspergillus wentii]
SLEAHLREIDSNALPQTLWDAILVCRALGVNYIWIDALCIIQGDLKDWERESSQIAEIYSHAFLTVCAAQGTSCQSGFLERDLDEVQVSFRSSLGPGWTFQEAEFASRLLLFGENMAYLDKLTAISALARRFGKNIKGQYLAGMWSDNLHHGLLWRTKSGRSYAEYTAPSWSWASQDGGVSVEYSKKAEFHLLDAKTVVGEDPYGQVTGGYISLSARVIKFPSHYFEIHKFDGRSIKNPKISSELGTWAEFDRILGGDPKLTQHITTVLITNISNLIHLVRIKPRQAHLKQSTHGRKSQHAIPTGLLPNR